MIVEYSAAKLIYSDKPEESKKVLERIRQNLAQILETVEQAAPSKAMKSFWTIVMDLQQASILDREIAEMLIDALPVINEKAGMNLGRMN